ncbi:MAG: radical SAM protein [Deltaproteobacteria bacterium]|nr:radical SAM protein [Deltaproteobacteria bacterium]
MRMSKIPRMLFADKKGMIYDHPDLEMVGFSQNTPKRITWDDLIPLPPYSKLFYIPDSLPMGRNPATGEWTTFDRMQGKKGSPPCYAVAAFICPGYIRSYLPAADYSRRKDTLPLWAYSAVGFANGQYYVPAVLIEENEHWNPANFDDQEMVPFLEEYLEQKKENRLVKHLSKCAVDNHCFAAKNLFLKRWEAPLPVSRRCNARCLGCISLQPKGTCAPSHQRIAFLPNVEEIVEIAVPHLEQAEDPIVSFGQGCEGEPLTETDLIVESIREIRRKTSKGVINLNTNGSYPGRVDAICKAGLNSIRVSLSSARETLYHRYYRPTDYQFEDVLQSLRVAKTHGIFTMINYLVFPGISDQPSEIDALRNVIDTTKPSFIHMKNLNIDPQLYIEKMEVQEEEGIGMQKMIGILQEEFPHVRLGYFNQSRI